jgi:hypothetical protein
MSQSTKSGRTMTMTHKIMNGRGELDPLQWFEAGSERVTCSSANPLNLRTKHGRMELRRNFFSVRVIDSWNAIPSDVRAMANSEFQRKYKQLRAAR